ncbi:MAG: response regulator [Kouleothrix sp.]
MDVQMPHLNGVAAAADHCGAAGRRVIILTTFDYDEYVFEGIKAGARGYLLKDTPADELLVAIGAYAPASIVQPSIAARLIAQSSPRGAPHRPSTSR